MLCGSAPVLESYLSGPVLLFLLKHYEFAAFGRPRLALGSFDFDRRAAHSRHLCIIPTPVAWFDEHIIADCRRWGVLRGWVGDHPVATCFIRCRAFPFNQNSIAVDA